MTNGVIEKLMNCAPRDGTNVILHDENGDHPAYFSVASGEWRKPGGEVLSLEGLVTWSYPKPPVRVHQDDADLEALRAGDLSNDSDTTFRVTVQSSGAVVGEEIPMEQLADLLDQITEPVIVAKLP